MHFIVFEGLDGSGKTTSLNNLKDFLESKQQKVQCTREPGGTPLAEEIRRLILQNSDDEPVARTEILLYQAARSQHVETKIRPLLRQGNWVLCDRFTPSTVAFQSAGRDIDDKEVQWLNQFATAGLTPDLTVLLDINVETSRARLNSGQAPLDRIEQEGLEFHTAVRNSYLLQSSQPNWLVLDAQLSPEEITKTIVTELEQRQWI